MDITLKEFLQKKIQRLEIQNIELQEALITRPPDQYQLKYQMLLEKITQED